MSYRCPLFAVPAAFCVASLCFLPTVASAQTAASLVPPLVAPQGKPLDLPLLITAPPGGGRVTLEVDARNDDVLGLVKDLVEGITVESSRVSNTSKSIAPTSKPVAPTAKIKPAAGAKKNVQPTPAVAPPKITSTSIESGGEFVEMLQQMGITEILRPITHIHVLVISFNSSFNRRETAAVPSPPSVPRVDPVSFYEAEFKNEGGHRLVWSEDKKGRLLIMGFDTPRKHFAVVSDVGSSVTIVRADGYPDVKKLSKFIKMLTE